MRDYYRRSVSDDSGIYCILNKLNQKRYIGQTYSIKNRFYRHKKELRKNAHHNNHLQSAWNKYGEENFEFSVIEYCEVDLLNEREAYWINFYDSFKDGYNQTTGDIGCRGYKHTKEELIKMRARFNPKAVCQLDENFNIIKKWESISLIAKTLGVYRQAILNCCEKQGHVKSVKGFIWVYEDDINNIDYAYYSVKNISLPKKVGQFDENLSLVKIWESIYSVKEGGFDSVSSVSNVCNHRRNSYKGYIWAFVDETGKILDNYDYSNIKPRQKQKIAQCDTGGNILHIYNSLRKACDDTGFDRNSISKACKDSSRIYKNYKWRYVD